jgi:hypothetical protein
MPTRRGQPTGRVNVTYSVTAKEHKLITAHAKRQGLSPGAFAKRLTIADVQRELVLRKAIADQQRKDRQNAQH